MIIFDKVCPKVAMDFLIDDAILHRADVWPLFSAIYRDQNPNDKRDVKVKVLGTFRYAGTKAKRSGLDLNRVLDLKVARPAQ